MNKNIYRIISVSFLFVLLSLIIACDRDKDLNDKIEFFSKQERDPQIMGTWKRASSKGRDVEVIDFIANGRYQSNMGTPYTRYYTKNQKLYLLRTGNHSNNPIVVVKDYQFRGDSLILTYKDIPEKDKEAAIIKEVLIKL